MTDIYLQGWGQSLHFCRYPRGAERNELALARHEHYLASMMGLRSNMRVLDVGCGVGGPAREIIAFTGCHIIGLNFNEHPNPYSMDFVPGDFMHMPFDENQFDAVYVIEAAVHAPSLHDVYLQCYRVLKPGGVFGVYEWALTTKFDPSNGIPALQTSSYAQQALRSADFEVCSADDLAANKDPLGWWNPLSGDVKSARGVYDWLLVVRNTWWGRPTMRPLIKVLEWVGIAPRGTATITEDLLIANDALVAGGREEIFTPMFLMITKKPSL
ncbi:hypothetical protein BU23DRAFT_632710 [Bimuria novae-zelandiae CBS 107.79]|uniref:Sterol 24-C-methyltransferase n=1 Tax=Bimuria novae-zelandiae CBS 107.79 TaxID=1447943 RepID=A0A6A5VGH9_9PLEO|nr:hypothetical protein BU23DRAFT_632710 [Bimuria novae-zelandiae CBS 107.79]